ncbi:MAG TPA: response regulator [Thalassobaculum sp.]
MPDGPSDLTGLRILVVEDNLLLADVVCEALEQYGCEVIGPFASLHTGLQMACHSAIDGALLDVRLCDGLCFPIAEALEARHVPYLFLTGYDDERIIPPAHRRAVRLAKPIDPDGLAAAISASCRVPAIH